MSRTDYGIHKLATGVRSQDEVRRDLMNQQIISIKGKLSSLLLSSNTLKTDAVKQALRTMEGLSSAAREAFVMTTWGPLCHNKVMPLLQQLATLETELARI